MQHVWEMLSDTKIMSLLENLNQEIDQDITRLMFIELLSRVKQLEQDNLALRLLLMQAQLIDDTDFSWFKEQAQCFLKQKDEQNSAESSFFKQSGVSFPEFVNFKLHGCFNQGEQN